MAGSDEGAQDFAGQAAGAATSPAATGGGMSPAQCRGARGLLGWSEADLAGRAGLDEGLVRDFEAGHRDPPSGQIEALRSHLMRAGAQFTEAPQGVHLGGAGTGGDEGTRLDALTTENDR